MECNIEYIIDEITKLIKDNLILFLHNDKYLINLKEYCKETLNLDYVPYYDLIYFVREALVDLINADYLYDFRDIE